MNRCALSIKMLHILYGRNKPISKLEIAQLLETNPRNISEFKKELEIAGYMIESTTGKYGGYILNEDGIFPSLALNKEEKEAVNESITYLKTQKNFIYFKDFNNAMDKLKAKLRSGKESKETIYLNDFKKPLTVNETNMVNRINEAIKQRRKIAFYYQSNSASSFVLREVQPYEMIVNNDGFYILAYDISKNKKQAYKFFKIIEERMKEVNVQTIKFTRDYDFKVSDYIGKQGLMKDLYEIELEVRGIQGRLVNEKAIENIIEKRYENEILYLKFIMEGKHQIKSFILSLGQDCKVIAPKYIKEEIYNELQVTLKQYVL